MNNKVENYTETQLVECLLNHAIMQTSFVELRDLKPSTPTFKLLRRFYQERTQKNSYGEKGPNLKKESGDQMEQKQQNH